MIYPDNFEQKLGFTAVRREISRLCNSPMGAEYAEAMAFSSDFAVVERALSATADMLALIQPEDSLPLSDIRDIRPTLAHISVPGTYATAEQLAELLKMVGAMTDLRRWFDSASERQDQVQLKTLLAIASPLAPYPAVAAELGRIIDRFGNIRDNASPQLAEIRGRLRSMANSINAAMHRVIARAQAEGLIDKDTAPTVRDGRLVLPVAPMNKRRIGGIVHDESATGKTVFIEPAEVVEANNNLRALQNEEHREEIRILAATADWLRPYIPDLADSTLLVGEIDFIHAKAVYARDGGGEMPTLENGPELEWYGACHPVLLESLRRNNRQIVPLDITLSEKNRILVISGPNAGGKSVCLKTVGTLQYMLQSGILPTAHSNSRFGIFRDIFVDIGDDQSIENDLSTYSSHLRNMKMFLRHGRRTSLMLIDEFGSGTEPQIGAALAQAILQRFNENRMWGVITTHYQNLKHFAEDTDGLVNGSMLYDRQLMQPLFTLSIGNAGSSFAIEIARKTGLPSDIIAEAQKIVGSDYINTDKFLLDIARDKKYWEQKRLEIHRKEKKLDEITERYEHDADQLREKRREIIGAAKEEARRIVEGTNAAIERTITEIRRTQAEKESTRQKRQELKETLAQLTDGEIADDRHLRRAPSSKKNRQRRSEQRDTNRPAAVGDNVRLDGEGTVGKVLSIEKGKATVLFGNLKTTVQLSRLKPTNAEIRNESRSTSVITQTSAEQQRQRQLDFKRDIDLRGMRADEALQAVTYFIDDAIQFNVDRVRILHGTGTGALRQVIRQYLSMVHGVASFRDEHVQFGGAGITVVDLR
ncbi:MAG: Smr/MutS family protein [Clostridium sp.]|nr:Smr/MutS family protein [Clostridium sp.]